MCFLSHSKCYYFVQRLSSTKFKIRAFCLVIMVVDAFLTPRIENNENLINQPTHQRKKKRRQQPPTTHNKLWKIQRIHIHIVVWRDGKNTTCKLHSDDNAYYHIDSFERTTNSKFKLNTTTFCILAKMNIQNASVVET